ncbi:MAG: 16S rRNA (guanine(527)-N(7))-methyltransferase RsmG [Paludibacteraceae bacterium]|nr:16S rRNA (guanine(527)-N(7))-methyltransferase RsmG [Paludibacteraceae bacterium]
MTSILKYFPTLTAEQIDQFSALDSLYRDWNSKINVISRKDIDNLYEHHVLHSLAIAKILRFQPGTDVVDIGTGGGFPGIPLAIMFPECRFTLVDSVGKKIKVASEVAASLGLKNVNFVYDRMENVKQKFDFAVSRAAMSLDLLVKVCRKNINKAGHNALPNGLICLKGGELETEVKAYSRIATLYSVSEFFSEEYFQTKKAVYLPL